MRRLILVCLLLLLISPTARSQVPDDKLIVPGQRIGKWTLGMTVEEINRSLGRFHSVSVVWRASGFWQDFLTPTQLSVYHWPGAIYAGEYVTENRGVTFMETWSPIWTYPGQFDFDVSYPPPEFKTEKGIGVNSSRAAVLTAYGTPSAETRYKGFSRLIYNDAGLAFLVDDVKVHVTIVFRPDEARTIWKF